MDKWISCVFKVKSCGVSRFLGKKLAFIHDFLVKVWILSLSTLDGSQNLNLSGLMGMGCGTSWTSGDKLDKFGTAAQVVRISFPLNGIVAQLF